MKPEDFVALGQRALEELAGYWRSLPERPVLCPLSPGDVLRQLPAHPPETGLGAGADVGAAWEAVWSDVQRTILPGLTHWQSPGFYAFFPANISGPAVLGELLCAGLGVQGMLWATSPACTELEMRVMDWLAEMLDLPGAFFFRNGGPGGGVIQGTASEAAVAALAAARARARKSAAKGAPFRPVVYITGQTHSSLVKAAMVTGIAEGPEDREAVRIIATDANLAMRADALRDAIAADRAQGRTPLFVCVTIGTTGTTAIDPLAEIAEACSAGGPAPWLHVDAAYAGAACICPEFRPWLRGIEHADSFCFNPHKWLLTNFDCDCMWVRDRGPLLDAMSVTPEYLRNPASAGGDGRIDYRDWHVPLGRRFRALKLWLVIRHYGVEGLRAYIREHVRIAAVVEGLIAADGRFELAAPRTMNLLCFRLRPRAGESAAHADARTRELLNRINASGRAYLSHTLTPSPEGDRFTIRMAIGTASTREQDAREAWGLIAGLADGC